MPLSACSACLRRLCCDMHKIVRYLHIGRRMVVRTNIDIDDRLMRQAMRHSGARTKKAAVEAGLQLLVRTHMQNSIRRLRGKVRWEGDLAQSRLGRNRGHA
jgi:Arc/MetJ family transcription regulator